MDAEDEDEEGEEGGAKKLKESKNKKKAPKPKGSEKLKRLIYLNAAHFHSFEESLASWHASDMVSFSENKARETLCLS